MLNERELIKNAFEARKNAYTNYSNYKVGAALLSNDGKIYKGCNVECSAYSVCTCAERVALLKAVSENQYSFNAIAIVGGHEYEEDILSDYAPPCGVCRQYLREFCDPETFTVILAKSMDDFKVFKLKDLLPFSFGPDNLKK